MKQGTGNRELGTRKYAALRAVGSQAVTVSGPRTPNPEPRSPLLGSQFPVPGPRAGRGAGFTLIELIVVVAIIGILATIAVPAMRTAPQRAREAALKENLFTIRSCIDQFHADRGRYPASLEELVSLGYLRSLPLDPVTRSTDTWVAEYPEVSEGDTEREQEENVGIIDVRSGSEETALDGTLYADW